MPRVVDHDQRRALIARTFQQHLVRHGLQATTFARVAAAAGISVGLIQHYFGTREELLRHVYGDALRSRDERIAVHIADGEAAERPIRDILATAVRELLPLDATRVVEFHVTHNLLTQALHDPVLAEVAAGAHHALHLRAAAAVGNGKECGEVEAGVDPDLAAELILAAAHGLATRLALARVDRPDELVPGVLDPVLRTVFTGRCRHHEVA